MDVEEGEQGDGDGVAEAGDSGPKVQAGSEQHEDDDSEDSSDDEEEMEEEAQEGLEEDNLREMVSVGRGKVCTNWVMTLRVALFSFFLVLLKCPVRYVGICKAVRCRWRCGVGLCGAPFTTGICSSQKLQEL